MMNLNTVQFGRIINIKSRELADSVMRDYKQRNHPATLCEISVDVDGKVIGFVKPHKFETWRHSGLMLLTGNDASDLTPFIRSFQQKVALKEVTKQLKSVFGSIVNVLHKTDTHFDNQADLSTLKIDILDECDGAL